VGGIDVRPHVADDLGDLSDFGSGVVGLDFGVDLSSIEEES
jgi:hypothetical protein